ncbi:MAG: hypothetical protein K8T90_16795 [Planctomycetes bacterium]|nr:hypothetical protein [Planctomycetota bacterium]
MRTALPTHTRLRVVGAVALLCAATLVALAAVAPAYLGSSVTIAATPERVSIVQDGLLYEFHALTGTESLWDTSIAPTERRNLLRDRNDDARRLRLRLESELSDPGFKLLRGTRAASIERLKKLGYL